MLKISFLSHLMKSKYPFSHQLFFNLCKEAEMLFFISLSELCDEGAEEHLKLLFCLQLARSHNKEAKPLFCTSLENSMARSLKSCSASYHQHYVAEKLETRFPKTKAPSFGILSTPAPKAVRRLSCW